MPTTVDDFLDATETPQAASSRFSRPAVTLPGGQTATVRSIGVGDELGEWVIPTIVDGRPVSNEEAVSLWKAGKNKPIGGPFRTAEQGNEFGQKFHEAEAKRINTTADEFLGSEPSQDWSGRQPLVANEPSIGRRLVGGLNEGSKAFAKGARFAGRALVGGLADIGGQLTGQTLRERRDEMEGGPYQPSNIEALVAGETMPAESDRKALPTLARISLAASQGLVESVPKLAAVAGAELLGVPAPVSAAAVFGSTEEGFSPKDAAIAAALPFVGKYTGQIVGALAKKLGVSSTDALNIFKGIGGTAGAAAYMATISESEIQNLPPEQRKDARIEALASLIGQAALGPMGVKFDQPGAPEIAGKILKERIKRSYFDARREALANTFGAGEQPIKDIRTPQARVLPTQPDVPVEPGPIGVIPEGGTAPQPRPRIRISRFDQPITQGVQNALPIRISAPLHVDETSQNRQAVGQGVAGPEKPAVSQEERPQPSSPDVPLSLPKIDDLSAMPPDQFAAWQKTLGPNQRQAQQQYAQELSEVRLRSAAQDAWNEYKAARAIIAQKRGTASEAELTNATLASQKGQFFNEALREGGYEQVRDQEGTTVEGQVGVRKKGGRKAVMGSGVARDENALVGRLGLDKLENDWSVATRPEGAKTTVSTDTLKTGDKVTVRGEELTISDVDAEGVVKLQGPKKGRWGERMLQPGQQIAVDKFESGPVAEFVPEQKADISALKKRREEVLAEIDEMQPPTTAEEAQREGHLELEGQIPWSHEPRAEALRNELYELNAKIPYEPETQGRLTTAQQEVINASQKYRIGTSPQTYSLIERLSQTDVEREAGEQPVRVRNDKTGKDETVLESELKPVRTLTAEERAASKAPTKKDLNDELLRLGVDNPDMFPSMASKREQIKRLKAMGGERNLSLPVFYSRITRAVEESPQGKATGAQWKAMVKNKGAYSHEWSLVKVDDLDSAKTYTKQEVLDYLKANEIQVKDVTLGGKPIMPGGVETQARQLAEADGQRWDMLPPSTQNWFVEKARAGEIRDATHFASYQLPGAKEGSYREVLLTVPEAKPTAEDIINKYGFLDAKNKSEIAPHWEDGHSQYGDIPNPIVRLRFNERTTANGKRMLFLEEVQSPQKGQFEKMPALFQKQWRDIAFKWALRHAAENGFDSIGWTTGEQQAARYDLSKQIRRLLATTNPDGYGINAWDHSGKQVIETIVSKDKLPDTVGKELASKIENQKEDTEYSGLDLKVGGEGLKKLYDQDFRNVVNSLDAVKKAGQKTGTDSIGAGMQRKFVGTTPLSEVERELQTIRNEWDGPGRTAEGWQRWNVSLDAAADKVVKAMRGASTYEEAMQEHGSPQLASALGGKFYPVPKSETIHSLEITPEIRESVMKGQRLASIGTLARTAPSLRREPTTLNTPEEIRQAISDPKLNISPGARKAVQWWAKAGLFEKFPGLRVALADYIEGGARGEYIADGHGNNGLARFLRWTDSDTAIEEFLHHVNRFLSDEDLAWIKHTRLTLVDRLAPQMGAEFRNGISSDTFMERGYSHDLYHLSNDHEFFAWLMSDKALKEMNAPEARTFIQKIKVLFRDLYNAFKDAFGIAPYEDVLWRKILSGKTERTVEDSVRFHDDRTDRHLALSSDRRTTAEQVMNYEQMGNDQRRELVTNLEAQNAFADRFLEQFNFHDQPAGVKVKFRALRDRAESLADLRGHASQDPNMGPRPLNYEDVLADPQIRPEIKQMIVGDMLKNATEFRESAQGVVDRAPGKIEGYETKIGRLLETLDLNRERRVFLERSSRQIISDYQNRYMDRVRTGTHAGQMEVSSEVLRALEQLKQSPEIISRIIEHIAQTVPPEVLTTENVSAPHVLEALLAHNGGDIQTLAAAMGESQRGIAVEELQRAITIMQASDDLAQRVLTIRPSVAEPENWQAVQALATELRTAARRGARGELRNFIRELGETAKDTATVKDIIKKLSPMIRRATIQANQWATAQDMATRSLQDPEFRSLEAKLLRHYGASSSEAVTHGELGEWIFKNPKTGKLLRLFPTMSGETAERNYAQMQELLNDASEYLADPAAPGFEPALAAAYRHIIDNLQGFWLNPGINPFAPHPTPFKFDMPAFLSDPNKVLRAQAGFAMQNIATRGNAYVHAQKLIFELEKRLGPKVDIAIKTAARKAKLSTNDWRDQVYDEIAFRQQFLATTQHRIGDTLLSGHVVTEGDLAAAKTIFEYQRKQRDIAENAQGFRAAEIKPVRVVSQGLARKAIPSGEQTVAMRPSGRAGLWASQWRQLSPEQRRAWLDDPNRFERIVMGHLDSYGTPGYKTPSEWKQHYRDIVADFKRNEGPQNMSELADRLFELQPLSEEGERVYSKNQITQQLVGEIARVFEVFDEESKGTGKEKPGPSVVVISAENAFSKPRAEGRSVPFTFYDLGVGGYGDRIRSGNDATVWYARDFEDSMMDLRSALNTRIAAVEDRIKSDPTFEKALKGKALRGEEFFDLAELKLNRDRINTHLKQFQRIAQAQKAGRGDFESEFYRVQGLLGGSVLMSAGARSTHTYGMFGLSGLYNALVTGRLIRGQARHWLTFWGGMIEDIARLPVFLASPEKLRALRDATPIGKFYFEHMARARERADYMAELGTNPRIDVSGTFRNAGMEWKNLIRPANKDPLGSRVKGALRSSVDSINALLQSYSPQRWNDWLLNGFIPLSRKDLISDLSINALKHLRNRSGVIGTGYSDFSRPENILTAQELTGKKSAAAEYQASELRRVFKFAGMDVDGLMLRYFRAVDEARASGRDAGEIAFLTPDESKSLDWQIALEAGLNTQMTRNMAGIGSLPRRAMGFIHMLPVYQMGRRFAQFNRLSNQKGARHIAGILPGLLAVAVMTTLYGVLRRETTRAANQLLYKQSSTLPGLGNLETGGDWARYMIGAQATWFPFIGDIVQGALLRQPDRFGHLDSQFVMYSFVQDLINTAGDMWHTKSFGDPILKFSERWGPITKPFTRRMDSQAGTREHYNAEADIQSAMPVDMERAAAKFRGKIIPTETTPLVHQAINAMYQGDWSAFAAAEAEYAAKKSASGVKDPETAFRHSIAAYNPWLAQLGRLPTELERAQIMSRMTDAQREEVQKSESVFRDFGNRYNTRISFTAEESEGTRGAAGAQESATRPVSAVGRGSGGRIGISGSGLGISGGPASGSGRIRIGVGTKRSGLTSGRAGLRTGRIGRLRLSAGRGRAQRAPRITLGSGRVGRVSSGPKRPSRPRIRIGRPRRLSYA